jgi:uncharacterized membrane protein
MRNWVWGVSVLILLALTPAATGQVPGPMATPEMTAPPGSGDEVNQMARVCTPMVGQMMGMPGGMMNMAGGMVVGMMPMVWWWGLQALVFWGMLLALAVPAILLLLRPRRGASEALSMLQVRMAKGEISPEEYEQRRRLL